MAQNYLSQVWDESVLVGNSAILRCQIPSFVADFVSVQSWQDEEGVHYSHTTAYGAFPVNTRYIFSQFL